MFKLAFSIAMAVLLSACGTTSSGLKYLPAADQAPRVVASSSQPVFVGSFRDDREGDKKWLGVIRGGFGNHLKTLEADMPVTEMVRNAFADGLRVRQAKLEQGASNVLTGEIVKLYADQYVRREGVAEIVLTVSDAQGRKRFGKTYSANRLDGSLITLSAGVFASVEDLRAVLEKTLSELVDKALDDPELRAALQL